MPTPAATRGRPYSLGMPVLRALPGLGGTGILPVIDGRDACPTGGFLWSVVIGQSWGFVLKDATRVRCKKSREPASELSKSVPTTSGIFGRRQVQDTVKRGSP